MNRADNNIWLNGVKGVVVGDALGCPVQFMDRSELKERGPVTEVLCDNMKSLKRILRDSNRQ